MHIILPVIDGATFVVTPREHEGVVRVITDQRDGQKCAVVDVPLHLLPGAGAGALSDNDFQTWFETELQLAYLEAARRKRDSGPAAAIGAAGLPWSPPQGAILGIDIARGPDRSATMIVHDGQVIGDHPGNPIRVVAAVRVSWDGRLWCCRRTADGGHGGLAGKWEYPGGKAEDGESLEDALRREMREEFGVEIVICQEADMIPALGPGGRVYAVTFFVVTFLTEPQLRVHDAADWFTLAQLAQQDHLPSGTEFNRRLALQPLLDGRELMRGDLVEFDNGVVAEVAAPDPDDAIPPAEEAPVFDRPPVL